MAMKVWKRVFLGLLAVMAFCVHSSQLSLAETPPATWRDVQRAIAWHIHEANAIYEKGAVDAAREILSDAYFEKFEALGMEMVVKKYISSARAYQLERMFGEIRKRMNANDSDGVRRATEILLKALEEDADILDLKNIRVEGAGYVTAPRQAPDEKPAMAQTRETISQKDVAGEIERNMKKALSLYRAGDSRKAKALVSDTYFDLFEGKGLEAMIAMRSSGQKAELESKFGVILGLMDKAAPDNRVEQAIDVLSSRITEAAGEFGESTGWIQSFIASFFIIAREGFEAILILSALVAYLRRTGNDEKVRIVGMGALIAVFLSIITAAVFVKIYARSAASREILEGITMLVAAAVLFYVSYWLTSKAEAAKWMSYIQKQVAESVGRGNMLALGFASFIVVYREGAETILFYSALFANVQNGGAVPVSGGFLAGSAALVAVYYAFKHGTAKIPIRPFFNATSVILFYMAFVFAGDGIMELQTGGLIKATPVDWAPRIGFLGIHPTLESLLLQSALMAAALAALGYLYILQPFKARGRVLQEAAHVLDDLHGLHGMVEHIRAHVTDGMNLTAPQDEKDREIREHLNEIDENAHDLIGHLNDLQKSLASILGNIDDGKETK